MQVLLRDLAPGQTYAIQFRSNDGHGGTSDWSQVQRFTTTADTMPPADVQNLSLFSQDDAFIAQWDAVTTNADGTTLLDFRYYHIHVSSIGASGTGDFYVTTNSFELTKAQNIQTFGSLQTALTFSVTAVDMTYNESIHPAVITLDPAAPPTPSAPVVGNYIGLLLVSWDGLTAGGGAMPENVMYAEVHVSTVSGFTPTATTLRGRVFPDGSASKTVVSGLTIGTTYYVRLVAVNLIQKRSGPSDQGSGSPTGVSGLDIQNGQIAAEQINWTSTNIPGGNAYYSTSQPTVPIGTQFNTGDIWYDTDNAYTTYQWDGTTWVLAPNVGFIPATKLIAGTITGDRIATNFFDAAYAHIGSAFIDSAMISTVNAGSITTGSISAGESIIAGDSTQIHAEMKDTGFYVYAPGVSPDGGVTPPPMIPAVKMGTGDGDTFSITDPNNSASTLASISQDGVGSFQQVAAQQSLSVKGRDFETDWMENVGGYVGAGYLYPITGLDVADSSGQATGIRSEYGIGQFSFKVQAGHTYEVKARLNSFYFKNGGEATWRLRMQPDGRSPADIAAGVSPTACTISSSLFRDGLINSVGNGWWQTPTCIGKFDSTTTGVMTVGYSLELGHPVDATSVIKIPDNSVLDFTAMDLGKTSPQAGQSTNMGGTLYNYVAPPPPPPPPPPSTQNYSGSWGYNWVRSYKGNNTYMTNTNGLAYQGVDPSGYNGNQMSLYGFSQCDFHTAFTGATNVSMQLYIYYAHWYYNSGGTAVIGWSGQYGDPGTANFPGGTSNMQEVSGVAKPGSLTIWLPSSFISAFTSGAARSIMLGPGPSTSETYYGYASNCTITAYWTK